MKKQILAFALLSVLAISCGETTEEGVDANATVEKVDEKLKSEVLALDSAAAVLENAATDLEESSAELDELLNGL